MNLENLYRAQYLSLLQLRENTIKDLEDLNTQIKSLVRDAKIENITLTETKIAPKQ